MGNLKEKWMSIWGGFEEKHPKLAKWVYQIFYFFVFSMGVTVFQYLVFTFMPGILGIGLAGTEFMWPQKEMHLFGVDFTWSLLGYNVLRDASGAVMIGADLDILSVTKRVRFLHNELIFLCREISLLRVKEILFTRQCGTLSHG